MHYILFYEVIDHFTEKRIAYRKAHLEHAREAYKRGELILGGSLIEPTNGSVLVFNGASEDAAEEFAKTDPYVVNGLVKSWKVRKWMTVIGEGSTPP